tara:strand:+ start:360 stop:872 length:513 start_codon:yes stop_codon:yes gene_type:complete
MPKGLKQTSSIITIGARVSESAVDTFTQSQVDLQLNPLDNEVFVVLGVNLDVGSPDLGTADSATTMTMTATSQESLPTLAASSVLAKAEKAIRVNIANKMAVQFQEQFAETPPSSMLDYVGIIATNDFFLQIQGSGNAGKKTGSAKVYGYRAKAEASTYAALVQSEVLTA